MNERDLLQHGAPAADLVMYQPGAVVSRTLLKTPAGTVTAFAFDAGQELSEHTTPFDALVHVLDGETEIRVSGTPHALRAGDLLLMPGGAPHAVRATTRFKMLLVMLRAPGGQGEVVTSDR